LSHLDLGIVYESEGRKPDALREFQVSSKLNPSDENVHWRLGRLYQSLGRKEEAKAEIEKTRNLQKVRDEPLVDKINRSSPKPSGQRIVRPLN
jgi:tetratricopeptide (TPR) repeat protein